MEEKNEKNERRERKIRRVQTDPASKIEDGTEIRTVADGIEFVFRMEGGTLVLVSSEKIVGAEGPNRPRYFRLRLLENRQRKTQASRRYFYRPDPGEKILRFFQKNFEGDRHDPAKEVVHMVTNRKAILDLSTLKKEFEEVSEEEYLVSRKLSKGENE